MSRKILPTDRNAQATVRGDSWSVVVFPERSAWIDLYLTPNEDGKPLSELTIRSAHNPTGYIAFLTERYGELLGALTTWREWPSVAEIREALEWCESALGCQCCDESPCVCMMCGECGDLAVTSVLIDSITPTDRGNLIETEELSLCERCYENGRRP